MSKKPIGTPTTALAVSQASNLPALALDTEELKANLAEVLGDGGLSFTDLTRVSVPNYRSGAFWSGPAEWDAPKQFIEGVIIAWPEDRTMWLTPKDMQTGPSTLPDCHGTLDPDTHMMTGSKSQEWIYNQFGANQYVTRPEELVLIQPGINGSVTKQACEECPFGQFKTGKKGGPGQFCNLKRHIYILTEDSPIPIVVQAATKSLKAAKQYLVIDPIKSLTSPTAVVTRLGLQKEGTGGANPYYAITFEKLEVLPPELKAKAKAYSQAFRPFIERISKSSALTGGSGKPSMAAVSDDSDFDEVDPDPEV